MQAPKLEDQDRAAPLPWCTAPLKPRHRDGATNLVWGYMDAVNMGSWVSSKETCMSPCTVTTEADHDPLWNFNMGVHILELTCVLIEILFKRGVLIAVCSFFNFLLHREILFLYNYSLCIFICTPSLAMGNKQKIRCLILLFDPGQTFFLFTLV